MPSNAELLSPAAPSARRHCADSILLALSAEERELFWGSSCPLEDLPAVEVLSDAELHSGSWDAILRQYNPTILVAAWLTPPLPEGYLVSPDCRLRYVCYVAGSVRNLVPRTFLERGGVVTNWGDLVAFSVAEHALLLALGALRNLTEWSKFIEQAPHERIRPVLAIQTQSIRGRKVGIHGYGRIARQLIELLRPFQVSIRAYSKGVPAACMQNDGVSACGSLDELFSSSEVLFECEALRLDTERCVSGRLLDLLPSGAVFVNVARGKIVDEKALLKEAKTGRIRIALDVVEQEPLTTDSPAAQISSALISPHIGGPTLDQYRCCGQMAWRNIARFQRGEPLEAEVTLDVYDRST